MLYLGCWIGGLLVGYGLRGIINKYYNRKRAV